MTAALAPHDGDPSEPFQVMPALTDTEFAALKESIRQQGCLVAIEYDEQGQVLDGHHRLRALRELGVTSHPRVIRAGLGSHADKVAHALALNLNRRHLTPEQRAQAVHQLREAGWSVRRIAAETGIPKSTVSRDLNKTPGSGPATITGEDGKTYTAHRPRKPTTVYVHSDHEQRVAETALAVVGEDAPTKALTLRRLERMRREKDAHTARAELAQQPGVPGVADIRHSDIADLDITPGTVDLILTDPPFLREHFNPDGPWETLGRQATRWLKPGGLLLAYCSHIHLARAIQLLGQYEPNSLDYWWTYAITFPGGGTGKQVRTRAISAAWRPVLAYRKQGGPLTPRFSADPVQGAGKEKDTAHPWQQGTLEARTLIDRLTTPGAVIVDPFTGSGTIPVAALTLGNRHVIAADIDPHYVALAQRRVAAAVATPELGTDDAATERVAPPAPE